MLRRAPTRVEVGQSDRDEVEELRKQEQAKEQEQKTQFEHLPMDRDLGTRQRIGFK